MTASEAREFLRDQLGDDWEDRLIRANAMAPPGATNEEVDAAQQRAVELVSEFRQDWTLELRENVADAWFTLWSHGDKA